MKHFSIIVTPDNYKEFFNRSLFSIVPNKLLIWILQFLPPFKIGKIVLKSHKDIEGDIILCPVVFRNKEPSFRAVKKIYTALKIAKKNNNKIIGLGTTTSYNNFNYSCLNKTLKMNLITGEYLSAVNSLNQIKKLLSRQKVSQDACKVLVIGDLSEEYAIFYLELISSYYKEINLLDATINRLPKILERIVYETGTVIKQAKDVKKTINEADIIIVTSSENLNINSSWLKPNVIINLLVNNPIIKQQISGRDDINLIEGGGLVELDDADIQGICLNNKKVYPWVAETILNVIDINLKTYQNADRLAVRIGQKAYKSALRNKLITDGKTDF